MRRINWFDRLVYRLYCWRWGTIYANNLELLAVVWAWQGRYLKRRVGGRKRLRALCRKAQALLWGDLPRT